jgi:hypothetical protein
LRVCEALVLEDELLRDRMEAAALVRYRRRGDQRAIALERLLRAARKDRRRRNRLFQPLRFEVRERRADGGVVLLDSLGDAVRERRPGELPPLAFAREVCPVATRRGRDVHLTAYLAQAHARDPEFLRDLASWP